MGLLDAVKVIYIHRFEGSVPELALHFRFGLQHRDRQGGYENAFTEVIRFVKL
jgi:hypothetical protein